ncbi:putative FAD binding domain-containing protein [Seiridium cardinale]|uniref:FAD binding domain-containing protein n=1 Tax=Seiridium cardinale TaxID=138064 RepID=A0ABR2XXZ7_9PEZI
MSTKTYDVLIVGAGPVGLLLACELRLAGDVSVLVLERDPDLYNTENPWKTAPLGTRGMNALSNEAFYRRGLLDKVITPAQWAKRPLDLEGSGFAGHFAGIMLDAAKVDRTGPFWKYKLAGPAFVPTITSLSSLVDVLLQRAEELGVKVRAGVEVTGLTQEDDSEEVVVHAANDEVFRGRWVVGCDGGRSRIRKAAGFDFKGTDAELNGYTVMCDLEDPQNRLERAFKRTKNGMYATFWPGHFIAMEPMTNGVYDRSKELTKEEFQVIVRRVTGLDDLIVKSMGTTSTYTDRSMLATTYRKGRVLLAGDSAHIHSPLGGQGLNAGVGDAMNLGWKLGAVATGSAPPGLLETYTQERHPIGAWVTEWTRAQVTTMKPDLHSQAITKVMKDLIGTRDGTTYMTERFWGLFQRYDLGLTDEKQKEHPLVGRSVPEFEFTDGSGRLGERMRSGRGLIINFGDGDQSALSDLAQKWHSKVDYVTDDVKDVLGLRALLVRPDGIVAWVAEGEPDLALARIELARWFGPETAVETQH